MATLTPLQRRWRGRIEAGVTLAAPLLDLMLYVGDKISRVVERDVPEITGSDEPVDAATLPHPRGRVDDR